MRGPRTLKGSKDPQIFSKELGDRKQWAMTSQEVPIGMEC